MAEFQLCFNTSTIRPAGLMDKIQAVSQAGWEAIELWLDDVQEHCRSGGTVRDVVKALSDAGLALPSVIALKFWSGTEGAEHAEAMEEIKRRLALAAELGAPSVVVTPTRERESVAETGRRYGELLAMGDQFGVKPAFEFIGFFEQYNNITIALEAMQATGRDDSTMVVDAFHIFRGEGDMSDVKHVPGDRISIVHIDDAPEEPTRTTQGDNHRVMPGDGIIDLPAFFDLLREQRYRGAISLELFNETYWARDPHEVTREGMTKTLEVLSGS